MTAGFEHDGPAAREQPVHQRVDVFLQQRLPAGDLDERTVVPLDGGDDLIDRLFVPLVKGIGRVAPGAAQIAGREPDEDTGQAGPRGFALNRIKDLVDGRSGSNLNFRLKILDCDWRLQIRLKIQDLLLNIAD